MSHQFKKTKKGGGRGGRGKKKRQTVDLMDLPDNVMLRVLTFLDEDSLEALSAVSQRSHNLVNQVKVNLSLSVLNLTLTTDNYFREMLECSRLVWQV